MKRIVTLLLFLISFTLHAQYERGNWYLSGNSTIDAGNQSTVVKNTFLSASPSRSGYFLLDRLLVGGDLLNPAVFVRYYQPLKPQGKLVAFAELNTVLFENTRTPLMYQPSIGLEYQFTQTILLSVRLQHAFQGEDSRITSLQFGINTIIGRGGLEPGQDLLRKGTFFIDPNIGQISLGDYNLSNGGINFSGIDLHFGGGIMLTDRISLDGSISLGNYQSALDFINTTTNYNTTGLEADLGLRYFATRKGKLRPYLGAGLSGRYNFRSESYETPGRPNEKIKDSGLNLYTKLGALFFLSEKVALDASVEYNFLVDENSLSTTSKTGLGAGFKIFLGSGKQ